MRHDCDVWRWWVLPAVKCTYFIRREFCAITRIPRPLALNPA